MHSAPALTLVASPATASSVCMPLTATPPGASSTFTVTVPVATALTRVQVRHGSSFAPRATPSIPPELPRTCLLLVMADIGEKGRL
jgi:hypothetical protein